MNGGKIKNLQPEQKNFRGHLMVQAVILLVWAVCCGRFLILNVRAHGLHFDTYGKLALLTQALLLLVLIALHGFHWKREDLCQWIDRHPVRILTYILLLCAFLVFHDYIYGYQVFVFRDIGADTTNQYVPVIFMVINKLKTGDFSFWEFNYGLGIDILNCQSQICDPFNWIYYVLGCFLNSHVVLYAIGLVQILKCMLCGWLTWLFLDEFSFSCWAKIFVSCVCAFSGFSMLWGQHYLFGTACVYLLLLIWLVEKSLRSPKNLIWFTLATAGVLMFSLYLAYMIALAAIAYLLVRLVMRRGEEKEKVWKILLRFIAAAVVGVLLSAVILLPVYYQQSFVSARLEQRKSLFQVLRHLFPVKQYISLLLRFFSNNLQGVADQYAGAWNYYESPQLAFSALILPFLVLFYAEGIGHNRKRRGVYILTAVMLAFSMLTPAGALVFNMLVNKAMRYTFVFLPVFAYVLAAVLSRMSTYHRLPLALSWVSWAGALAVIALHRGEVTADHLQGYLLALCVLVTVSLALVTASVCTGGGDKKNLPLFKGGIERRRLENCMTIALGVLVLLTAVWDGNITTTHRKTWEPQTLYANRLLFQDKDEVKTEAAEEDQDIFRIEKKFSDFSVFNDAIMQDYSGVSYYNTTYNKYVCEFIEQVWPEIIWDHSTTGPEYVQFLQDADNVQMAALLDVKYVYEDTKGEPHSLENSGTYQEVDQNSETGETLFENPDADGFGIVFEKTMDENQFLALSEEQRREVLQDTLVVDQDGDPYEKFDHRDGKNQKIGTTARETGSESYQADSTEYYREHAVQVRKNGSDGSLTAEVETDQDGMLFVSIPYDSGWSAKVNGVKTEIENADVGFQAVKIPAGKSTVTFHYETPLLHVGLLFSAAGLILLVLEFLSIRRWKA